MVAGGRPQQALGHPQPARAGRPGPAARAGPDTPTCSSRTSGPGTLEKWNLGYDRAARGQPAAWCWSGSAATARPGPYSSRAGYGSIGEAMGGLRYITGEPDRQPSRTGISIGDALAAMHATIGALAALRHRDVTGEGQIVDSAIYESVLAMMESMVTEWDVAGLPARAHRRGAAQRRAEQRLSDRRRPADPDRRQPGHGLRPAGRVDGRARARRARAAATPTTPAAASTSRSSTTTSASGPRSTTPTSCSRCCTRAASRLAGSTRPPDMLTDPHFIAREAIVRVPDPKFGDLAMQNVVPKLSATPGSIRWTGPELGPAQRRGLRRSARALRRRARAARRRRRDLTDARAQDAASAPGSARARSPAVLVVDVVNAYLGDGPLSDRRGPVRGRAGQRRAGRRLRLGPPAYPVVFTEVRLAPGGADAGWFAVKVPGLRAFEAGSPYAGFPRRARAAAR